MLDNLFRYLLAGLAYPLSFRKSYGPLLSQLSPWSSSARETYVYGCITRRITGELLGCRKPQITHWRPSISDSKILGDLRPLASALTYDSSAGSSHGSANLKCAIWRTVGILSALGVWSIRSNKLEKGKCNAPTEGGVEPHSECKKGLGTTSFGELLVPPLYYIPHSDSN